MSYTDENIIKNLQAGGTKERLAATTLFDAHTDFILLVANKYKLTLEERQSAYTDAVFAAIRAIKNQRFKEESTIKTYVSKIFNNKCVDLCKKNQTNKMKPQRADWIEDMLHLSDSAKSVADNIITKELVSNVMESLQKLGKTCRELLMAIGEGFTTEEIMQKFNYSGKGSVKTVKHRCVKKLTKLLE